MGSAAVDTKYIDLEEKIQQARRKDYLIINSNTGIESPYERERQIVIDKYFNGSYDGELKRRLLDMFERYNEMIRVILGL